MDDVYRDRQDPAVTVGLRADPRPATWTASRRWSGRRRRGRCRRTSRWPSIRTSTTSWSSANGERYVLADARVGAYARELGEDADGAARPSAARSCSARATRRRSTSSSAQANAHQRARRRLRHDRGRHRHRAHRAGVRRGGQGRHRRGGHRGRHAGEHATASSTRRCRRTRACTSSTRTSRSSAISRSAQAVRAGVLLRHDTYQHSYPHCWRCDNPLIQRAVTRGSSRSRRSATGWSS